MPIEEAGKGEHHVYRIATPNPADQGKLTAGKHYLGVDAVAWFVNKESSWFTDRMASGTLDIVMSGGLEKYQAALGTFELKSGARFAPVFDHPVLPDRNYRGGPMTFIASLTAIKKDTAIGGMLKSAASASLGIVAGMVDTATVAGPAKLLTAACEDLIGGVKKVLNDTAEKREPIFDFSSGLEYTFRPESVVGPQSFLLLHRGSELSESSLQVQPSGQLLLPFYESRPLEDGAWLLLRLRRSDEYSGVRDWFEDARRLRTSFNALVDDFGSKVITKEDALASLRPGKPGNPTLYDEFARLRAIIGNDGVLTEREAGAHVGELNARLKAALQAFTVDKADVYYTSLKETSDALRNGERLPGVLAAAFQSELSSLVAGRKASIARDADERRVAKFTDPEIFETMQYLPKTLRAIEMA